MANADKNALTLSSQPIPLRRWVRVYEFSKNFPAANVEALQENFFT